MWVSPTITPTWDVDNQCFTLTIGLPDGCGLDTIILP